MRAIDIPLINCQVSLALTWFETSVSTSKSAKDADPDANPAVVEINDPTKATLKIRDTNIYVPVVTLSIPDHRKFLE